jgi:hypothetical protein
MTILKYIGLSFLLAFSIFSCADVIDLDANFEESELVVDAWITQESTTQSIFLSLTQDYYQATTPPPVTNACIECCNE